RRVADEGEGTLRRGAAGLRAHALRAGDRAGEHAGGRANARRALLVGAAFGAERKVRGGVDALLRALVADLRRRAVLRRACLRLGDATTTARRADFADLAGLVGIVRDAVAVVVDAVALLVGARKDVRIVVVAVEVDELAGFGREASA